MEKIDLQKFQDYKLDYKQLSYIHAGECDTGAGMTWEYDSVGAYNYTYSSDYINSSGGIFYNDYSLFNTVKWDIIPSDLINAQPHIPMN